MLRAEKNHWGNARSFIIIITFIIIFNSEILGLLVASMALPDYRVA